MYNKIRLLIIGSNDSLIYLYHYFEKSIGAFKNLSELDIEEAQEIQTKLNGVFASKRNSEYLYRRKFLEQKVRELFIKKGGKPQRQTPFYMVVGECLWLNTWYNESSFVKIPISDFDTNTLSFTYGDTFPTFSDKVNDNLEYRKTVYTYDEILKIIKKYGLPQYKWKNPIFAQPAYVEVQVWSDDPIIQYRL